MKRILKIVVFASFVILFGGYLVLGQIVKGMAERIGPKITKTAVEISAVRLGPLTGWGVVKGFKLGNPEEFKNPFAVTVEAVKVSVRPMSLFSDVIHVRDVVITAPEIFYESNSRGSNLSQIESNVAAFAPPSRERQKKPKKIVIDHVRIKGAVVHWKTDVSLPDIELHDIGKGSGGIRPSEAALQILKGMTQGIARGIADSIKGFLGR